MDWWELVFMMLVLKLPIVYLCLVVYWAIREEPRRPEGAQRAASQDPEPWPTPRRRPRRPRPFRGGPHGSPPRTYARAGRARARRGEVER